MTRVWGFFEAFPDKCQVDNFDGEKEGLKRFWGVGVSVIHRRGVGGERGVRGDKKMKKGVDRLERFFNIS